MVRVVALAYLWDPAARPWLQAQPGCGAAACALRAVTNPTGPPVAAAAGYFTHRPPTDPPASMPASSEERRDDVECMLLEEWDIELYQDMRVWPPAVPTPAFIRSRGPSSCVTARPSEGWCRVKARRLWRLPSPRPVTKPSGFWSTSPFARVGQSRLLVRSQKPSRSSTVPALTP